MEESKKTEETSPQPQTWTERNFPLILMGGMVLLVIIAITFSRLLPR